MSLTTLLVGNLPLLTTLGAMLVILIYAIRLDRRQDDEWL